jgi:hypothetical protein
MELTLVRSEKMTFIPESMSHDPLMDLMNEFQEFESLVNPHEQEESVSLKIDSAMSHDESIFIMKEQLLTLKSQLSRIRFYLEETQNSICP